MPVKLDTLQAGQIIDKAAALGASLAGITPVGPVLECPSGRAHHGLDHLPRTGSVLVLALEHPVSHPELDYWGGSRGTEGNRILFSVSEQLGEWMERELGLKSKPLPYQVRSGGAYVKDAAVLAGIGVIGRNNLLITERFGPRVRLRCVWIGAESGPPPATDFDPCRTCAEPCVAACPQNALDDGGFRRPRCDVQMKSDEAAPRRPERGDAGVPDVALIRYCRACELSCPVARA